MKHFKVFILFIGISHLLIKAAKQINMKNWKTTVFGTLAAICASLVASKQLPTDAISNIVIAIGGLSASIAAFFAKDSDVTGVVKSLIIVVMIGVCSTVTSQTNSPSYPAQQTGGRTGATYITYNNVAYPLLKTGANVNDTIFAGKANTRAQLIIQPNPTDTNRMFIIVNRTVNK